MFIILMIVGAGWLALFCFVSYRSIQSNSWPQAVGIVISAEVKKITSRGGKMNSTTYQPVITYEYSVNSIKYQNNAFALSAQPAILQPSGAESILKDYPAGKQVMVFYNPKNPKDSALIPGGNWRNFVFIFFGLAVLVIGIVGVYKGW